MSALKLNGRQAADAFGVSGNFVSDLVKRGLVPGAVAGSGRRLRIDAAWVGQITGELQAATGARPGARPFMLREILLARATHAAPTTQPQHQLPIALPVAGGSPVLDVVGAAQILGVSKSVLHDLAMRGLFPTERRGRMRRLDRALVERLRAEIEDPAQPLAKTSRCVRLRAALAGLSSPAAPQPELVEKRAHNREALGEAIQHLLQAANLLLGIAARADKKEAKP